jgi:hypothetical protein
VVFIGLVTLIIGDGIDQIANRYFIRSMAWCNIMSSVMNSWSMQFDGCKLCKVEFLIYLF